MGLDDIIKDKSIPSLELPKDSAKLDGWRTDSLCMMSEHEYGYMPEPPQHLDVKYVSEDKSFCAGKAELRKLEFTVTVEGSEFSFPVFEATPNSRAPAPAFVLINFRPDVPDRYLPSEEICDRGFAVFSFCYKDITDDSDNFRSGIADIFGNGRRRLASTGKIAMWAWAAMRVMDHIASLPYIDKENVAIIGHSRLGKTALLAGAHDTRFKYVISNNSGSSGAAIARGKGGEQINDIINRFGYWFCPQYKKYACAEHLLPFDQHRLLALIPPRHLLIGSAELDLWADPESEFLSLVLANDAYAAYGMTGLIHGDDIPHAPTVLSEGDAHYHIRRGAHYLSREDWNLYMDFIEKKARK